MTIRIDIDDLYPFYHLTESKCGPAVEVPEPLAHRIQSSFDEFKEVQKILAELYDRETE